MAVKASRVTVGTSPTALNTVDVGGISGSGVMLRNMSAVTLYIGGSNVTTAAGYPLDAGAEIGMDFESGSEILYGIVATGTAEIAVLAAGS